MARLGLGDDPQSSAIRRFREALRRQVPFLFSTRRGTIELFARQDDAIPDGVVFIPFAYVEAAANLLTNPKLDPFGKIPEFKFCAAKVEAVHPTRASPRSSDASNPSTSSPQPSHDESGWQGRPLRSNVPGAGKVAWEARVGSRL